MREYTERMLQLAEEFKECQKAFTAIGDETRQQIIIALLEGGCYGIRVGEITKKTHLSRPAVSHHLQVMKEANIINMHREGTKNYYYMDANDTQWSKIALLIEHINVLIKEVSEKYQEDDCEKLYDMDQYN